MRRKKELLRIVIFIVLVAFMCGGVWLIFSGNGYTANAEDEETTEYEETSENSLTESVSALDGQTVGDGANEGVIPETEASKWFSETVMPLIMQYGAAAIGVLSAGFVLLGKITKTIREMKEAKNLLKSSDAQNQASRDEMKDFESRLEKRFEEYVSQTSGQIDDIRLSVASDVSATRKAVDKLLAVERRAYLDSPALVSDGTAKKIAEVIDGDADEENES